MYKRQTEQLKKVTSDVLNASKQNDQDSNAVIMNNIQPPTTSTCSTREKEDKDNTHQLPLQLPTIIYNFYTRPKVNFTLLDLV